MATISVEQIFKEFREHSAAEFFKKNRQMLGYSGAGRSLVTIVHEWVTNSVTSDTSTMVMVDGKASLQPIGMLIDRLMASNSERVAKEGDVESLRGLEGIRALCFDKNTLKLKFGAVKSVHRHRMAKEEELFTISVIGGAKVEATRHHSLFTLENGRVTPIKAEKLKEGSYIVTPATGWAFDYNLIGSINLIEEFLRLPQELTQYISVYGVKGLLYANAGIKNKIKAPLSKKERHYTFYSYYMKCDRLPLNLLRHLSQSERALFYKCKVGYRHGNAIMDNIINADEKLAKFLGLFTAEGSIRSNMRGIALSFGSKETELIGLAGQLVRDIFGITPATARAHATAINVVVPNTFVAFIMKHIFGYGHSAKDKIVPDVVFNFNKQNLELFLLSYLCGDGYPTKTLTGLLLGGKRISELNTKITAATASKALVSQISYVLSALGVTYSMQEAKAETRLVNGIEAHFGKSYRIEFWPGQKRAPLRHYPIAEGGIEQISDPGLKWAISQRSQKTILITKVKALQSRITMSAYAARFLEGDLGVLQVKEVGVRNATEEEYVYDYSIEDDENFVGGTGAVCLHNSLDACEEGGILPDINVAIAKMENNRFRINVSDNGPGIPKNFVGKALATIFAGTKFHRYMQQRGQQGIGAAGCLLFSQITTGKPIFAKSSTEKGKAYSCHIALSTANNKPIVTDMMDINDRFQGLSVEGEFADIRYEMGEHSAYEYVRRTALSNPHAQIKLTDPSGQEFLFVRSVKKMPAKPLPAKPHPAGLSTNDLLDFAHISQSRKISSFLVDTFARTTSNKISEIREVDPSIDMDEDPKQLAWEQAEKLVNAFKKVKWIAPDASYVVPIGEEQIKIALKNILNPEHMSVIERRPRIFRGGIPFVVEAAVAYGGNSGKKEEEGWSGNVLRFANRVPLLFDSGSCGISKAVNDIEWRRYNIDMETQPISVFVNVSSVYIPYSGVGKEAISQEDEIVEEIKLAVMEAARGVQRYIKGKAQVNFNANRYKVVARYVKQLSGDISDLTKADRQRIEKKLEAIVSKHFPKATRESEEKAEETPVEEE